MSRPGSSDDGRAFAARFAEAIFTAHQTLASAQEFYADIKRQAGSFGRSPDQIKILPGISPFIGSTQTEAERLQEEFNELIQPEYSLTQLRQMIGLDLAGFDLDGPLPRHLGRYRQHPRRGEPLQARCRDRRPRKADDPATRATPCRRARPLGDRGTLRKRSQTTFRPGSRMARPMASM